MNRYASNVLIFISLTFAPVLAERFELYSDTTYKIGNTWEYDYVETGIHSDGSNYRIEAEESAVLQDSGTVDSTPVQVLKISSPGYREEYLLSRQNSRIQWIRNRIYENEVATTQFTYSSSDGDLGMDFLPRTVEEDDDQKQIDSGTVLFEITNGSATGSCIHYVTSLGRDTGTVPLGTFDATGVMVERTTQFSGVRLREYHTFWMHEGLGPVQINIDKYYYNANGDLYAYANAVRVLTGTNLYRTWAQEKTLEQLLSQTTGAPDVNGDGVIDAADLIE